MRQRLIDFMTNPRVQVRTWAVATAAWIVMTPITLLTHLSHSIPYLNFLSLFANAASCGTAWVAAMSYLRARRVDEAQLHEKLDRLHEHLGVPKR